MVAAADFCGGGQVGGVGLPHCLIFVGGGGGSGCWGWWRREVGRRLLGMLGGGDDGVGKKMKGK